MAKSIDERVVSLRVNDREFQNAIDNVVKSLDGLKKSLQFKDTAKGFSGLNKAASNVKFDGLVKNAASVKTTVADIASEAQKTFSSMSTSGVASVGAISQGFSALQTVAFGAFASIGAKAVDFGKNFVSQFTSGITDGLNEYELQMNSIQTILTNTKAKGTTIDDVNVALKQLNDYADQTIYNFSQMTHNIGTFTAAGVDLDTSVASIKGIANLAAASGSSAAQASTAMYQLSQAIAAGRVSLMDWNSVVNAGMGGELFQNALKRTAENFGTDVDAIIEKYGSFRESLTQGQWLTTEVLTETLKQISGAYTEADLIAQGYSKQQAKDIVQMAQDAEDAATKITTFTKMIDTWKESIGSGWAQTWQAIFGDFTEARDFWTTLYNDNISPMVSQISDARNNLLNEVMEGSWDKLTAKIESTGFSVDDFKNKLGAVASENGQNLDQLIQKYGSFDNAMTSGALSAETIATAVKGFAIGAIASIENVNNEGNAALKNLANQAKQSGSALRDLIDTGGYDSWNRLKQQIVDAGGSIEEFQKKIGDVAKESGGSLSDLIDAYGGSFDDVMAVGEFSTNQVAEAIQRLSDSQNISTKYTEDQVKALRELADQADISGSSVNGLIQTLNHKSGRKLLFEGIINMVQAIIRPIRAIRTAFLDVFAPSSTGVYNFVNGFNRLSSALVMSEDTVDKLTRTFRGLFSIVKIFTSLLGGTLGVGIRALILLLENFDIGILDVTASIGDAMTALSDFILSGDLLTKGFSMLKDAAKNASPAVAEFFDGLSQYPLIRGAAEELEGFKRQVLDYIQSFQGLDVSQVFQKLVTDATPYLKRFADGVGDMASDVLRYFDSMIPGVRNGINEFLDRFPGLSKVLNIARDAFQDFTSSVIGYFKELLQLSPGEALAKIIEDVQNAFNDLSWSDIIDALKDFIENFDEFVDTITDGLKGIAPDILDGLIGGLGDGLKSVIGIMIEMGSRIISAIKTILGIHSPSTVMYEIGQNIVQGLMNGISSLIGGVAGLFSGMADAIGVELGSIDWGAVAVLGLSAGTLGLLFKFADALNAFGAAAKGLTAPASGVGAVLTSISKAIDQFSGVAAASSATTRFTNIANGIKTIAEAIAIIAGSVAALTLVDTDKMWQAVGAIGAIAGGITLMTGVMVGLSAVMGKFKLGSFKDIVSIDGLVLSISGSFVLLAVAMKIMGSLDDKALDKGIKVMERFQLLLANLVLIGGIFGKGVNFTSIGKMMTKLATTFLLASVAIRIIGGMEAGQIQQAVNALGMITLMLTAVVAVGGVINSMGGSVDKIGSTMLKLSAAIGIMALVCRMLGSVDSGALTQGLIATGALSLFIVGLIAATKLIGGRQIGQIGKTLLGISASIAILAGVAVALSGIDPAAFDNGLGSMTKVAALVLGIIAVMEIISKFGNTDLIKVGASLLLVSASVAILAGIAVLLSTINTAGLTKGIIAVGFLSLFVAAMVAASKGAENAKGTLIAVSVAVGILAAAVAALSFIPFDRLAPATAALSILMGMFALIMQSAKNVNGSVGTIITMSLVVGLLAGILIAMSALDVQNAMTNAVALSLLMATFAVSLEVMDNVRGISTSAMTALTLMAAIMAILALVLSAMSALDVQNAIPNAVALSILLATMTVLMAVLAKLNVSIPAAAQAAGALDAFIVVLGGLLVAIGALATYFPQVQEFIDKGGEIFEGIGVAIGKLIGGVAEGMIDAISNSLPGLGTALSTFAINLLPFITTMKMVDNSVIDAVSSLASAILQLTAGSFLDAIASFLGDNGIENLGTKLQPLATAMVDFSSTSSDINDDGLRKGVKAASALADILNSLPPAGAWQKISGEKDWSTLSDGLSEVAGAMKSFAEKAAEIKQDGMDKGLEAAKALNKLLKQLPETSVWDSLFDGEKSWSSIGDGLAEFGGAMKSFSESVSSEEFDVEAIKQSLKAASALNDFKDKLPDSSWLSEVWNGDDAWTEFGEGLKGMGEAMSGYSKAIGEGFDTEKVLSSITALKKFIPAIQTLAGDDAPNLFGVTGGFITAANQLGVGLRQYSEEVADIKTDSVINSLDPLKRLVTTVQSLGGKEAPDLSGISTGFITAANQLGVGLRQYSDEVADVVPETVTASLDPLKRLVSTVQGLGGEGAPDLSGVSVGFITAANQLGVGLRQYSEEVANVVPETVSSSLGPLKSLADTVGGLAGKDFSGAASLKTAMEQGGDFGLSKFGEAFAEQVASASANMQVYVDNLTNFGTNLASAGAVVSNAASTISTTFVSSISSSIGAAATGVAIGGASIVASLTSLAAQIVAFAAVWLVSFAPMNLATIAALNAIAKTILGYKDSFHGAGATLSSNLRSGMQSNLDGISTAFNGSLNSALSTVSGYHDLFHVAGYYVAAGFASGIRSGASMAVTAASNMAAQAIAAANAEAKIASPSRVMMRSGSWFTEGFAKGIGNSVSVAVASAKDMVGRAIGSANDEIKNGDALGIDATPTITPRLDLSGLRKDASGIKTIIPNKLDLGNEVGLAGSALGRTRSIQNAKVSVEYERESMYNRSTKAVQDGLRDLRTDMTAYQKAIESQETAVYVDGKKLASTIAKPMNQQLGVRSRRGSLSRV